MKNIRTSCNNGGGLPGLGGGGNGSGSSGGGGSPAHGRASGRANTVPLQMLITSRRSLQERYGYQAINSFEPVDAKEKDLRAPSSYASTSADAQRFSDSPSSDSLGEGAASALVPRASVKGTTRLPIARRLGASSDVGHAMRQLMAHGSQLGLAHALQVPRARARRRRPAKRTPAHVVPRPRTLSHAPSIRARTPPRMRRRRRAAGTRASPRFCASRRPSPPSTRSVRATGCHPPWCAPPRRSSTRPRRSRPT